MPATLDIYLPRRLPDEAESVAYFVVAEALTNVAKHAHATQAVVTVRLDDATNQLHVSVFDDGRGGAAITSSEDATGLRGLDERVRAARGTFTVVQPRDRSHHRHGGPAMRIVIAEDSALLRAGIERILTDAGHDVIAGVPDATNLLRLVNDTRPDLAIVDVRMPPTFTDEGIRAAALLRSQNPESPVLVLSHYVEERYAADLIASDTRVSDTCSRTASPTCPRSSTPSRSSAAAAPCSIPKWSRRSWCARTDGRCSISSPDANTRCCN